MKKNFWLKIKKPILALAPLAGFTDSAFRQICVAQGAAVLYSEMASAAALYYLEKGKKKGVDREATLDILKFNRRKEKNYVVQLFGSNPEHFAAAARIVTKKIRPYGIDINFGCPVPKICKQGAGAGLMKDLARSRAAIEAVLANTDLPVSIKIRTQSGEVDALAFMKNIADLPISALMIHGRSLKQGFAGPADFSLIKKIRPYFKGLILANGGINNLADAQRVLKDSGADGLGLGRGALGRPWLFQEIKKGKTLDWPLKKIFKIALDHATLEKKLKGEGAMIELRKHLVWYVQGMRGASDLRSRLVKVSSLKDIKEILKI